MQKAYLILLTCTISLLYSVVCFSGSVETVGGIIPNIIKRTGELEKGGPFFFISDGKLIINFDQLNDPDGKSLYEYRKWLQFKSDKKWQRVETKHLEALGFKEGMKFQFIEWKSKSKKEYTLKKFAHLAMIRSRSYDGQSERPYFRTFYIVLNDNVESIEHPDLAENSDEITGIAYTGNEYILQPSAGLDVAIVDQKAAVNELPKDVLEYFFQSLKKKVPTQKVSYSDFSYNGSKLYYITLDSKEWVESKLVLKVDDSFKDLIKNYNPNNLLSLYRFPSFIEGADLTMLISPQHMHDCYELIIVKDKNEKKIKLMCDSGGC